MFSLNLRWRLGNLLFIIMTHVCKNYLHTHHSLQWLSGYLEDKIFSTLDSVCGRGQAIYKYNSVQGYVEVYSNNPFFSNNFQMLVLYCLQRTRTTV